MALSPIIVFSYNRPIHLSKTLCWLKGNEHADKSVLFVFCDGPKKNASVDELTKIATAREVARREATTPAFKEVYIIERIENLGLGRNIFEGVSEVISRYGKAIILEDDLETSPLFLDYMNKCLDYYENRKTVFSISGLSRPYPERFFPKDYPYDVYVSLCHHPTGWATWADRWEQVDWEVNAYETIKNQPAMINAYRRLEDGEFDALKEIKETGKNLWSVRFSLAHFVNNAVSICPVVSYINHIGWDSEATNAVGSSLWNFERLADKKDIRLLDILYLDSRIINSWYSFSIAKPRSLFGKLKNWFGRKFLHRDEYALKGKVYDH